MLRSLFSGISGLRAHQQMMDVTGNNISNVNSVGYKAAQTVFQDTLSQMMRSAGAPQDGQGGTNPAQVGLGVRMAGINTSFTQGSAQATGRATDLMISGDGFFVVKSVNEQLFTRAGAFNFDADGRLVTPTGAAVQGWPAVDGSVDTNRQVGDIRLPMGSLIAPIPTDEIVMSGNLPLSAVSTSVPRTVKTYDRQGTEVELTIRFDADAGGNWSARVYDQAGNPLGAATALAWDAQERLDLDGDGDPLTPSIISVDADADPLTPDIDIDLSGLTRYNSPVSVNVLSQNGSPAATLQSFAINPDGQLVGHFSNGLKQTVAQVALANFNNAPGLEKVGDSLYRFTVNSGLAQIGAAGTSGLGTLQAGTVEMSNVDLAQEFTNLIVAQRGFQANSKVISTSDELLGDLVNLKR